MAHFAKLDENNMVVYVTVGSDADDGKELELSERTGEVYKQTSYNTWAGVHSFGGTPFRKNFAGIGYFYDAQRDAFIPPSPFPSWVLDEETCNWVSPVPMPENVENCIWDENTKQWIISE